MAGSQRVLGLQGSGVKKKKMNGFRNNCGSNYRLNRYPPWHHLVRMSIFVRALSWTEWPRSQAPRKKFQDSRAPKNPPFRTLIRHHRTSGLRNFKILVCLFSLCDILFRITVIVELFIYESFQLLRSCLKCLILLSLWMILKHALNPRATIRSPTIFSIFIWSYWRTKLETFWLHVTVNLRKVKWFHMFLLSRLITRTN